MFLVYLAKLPAHQQYLIYTFFQQNSSLAKTQSRNWIFYTQTKIASSFHLAMAFLVYFTNQISKIVDR